MPYNIVLWGVLFHITESMPSPAPVLGWLKKGGAPFDWEDDTAPRWILSLLSKKFLFIFLLSCIEIQWHPSSAMMNANTFFHIYCSIPLKALVAYRLHVGSFTGEANDIDERSRGTFLGVIEKIPHLLSLGMFVFFNFLFTHDDSTMNCTHVWFIPIRLK